MNTRLHKLCRQLELEPETLPAPRPADVRRRVNRALGRTGRPSRRALRTALAAAVIAALAVTSAVAVARSSLLQTFFRGDTQVLEGQVKQPYASVTDGVWTLTVEEVLADPCQALVTFSIQAHTDEAAQQLNRPGFFDMDTLVFSAGIPLSAGIGEEEERNTPTRRFYHLTLAYTQSPGPLELRLGMMEEGLTVSLAPDVDTVELDMEQAAPMLLGEECTVRHVMVSPIGMRLELELPPGQPTQSVFAQAFLLLEDGGVASPSMLTAGQGPVSTARVAEAPGDRYEVIWRFDQVLDLSRVTGIAVGDRVYSLSGGASSPWEGAEDYQTFTLPSLDIRGDGNPFFSLDELCAGLGLSYTWDPDSGTARVEGRNGPVAVSARAWEGQVLTEDLDTLRRALGVGIELSVWVTSGTEELPLTWIILP